MGKIKITLEDLFNLSGAVIYNPDNYRAAKNVKIDSRKISKGDLFVAIKGNNYDGHDFVYDAIKNGASAVLIEASQSKNFSSLNLPTITVDDTIIAYGKLAEMWRDKLSARVVSITGSNGKTSTKEILSTLLSKKYKVFKSEANNNNHIGVPLTIFSADEKCEVLILEQGTNHFGEISYSAKISKPDYALITNIGDSHLEFLKNRKGVYKEKSALFDETEKNNGVVFVNTDDPILKNETKKYSKKISFGFSGKPDVKGKILKYTDDGKTKIQVTYKNKKYDTVLPLYGESSAKNFLAAVSVALALGLQPKEILMTVKSLEFVHGRLEIKKFNKAVLIDDTYNSSPMSVIAAYELVKKIKTHKQKIVVLGDMFELGKNSAKFHKALSKIFDTNKNLFVLTVGKFMQNLTAELRKKKIKSIHFHLREALTLYLKYEDIDNSVILVKGSRGMKMEEFVKILEERYS